MSEEKAEGVRLPVGDREMEAWCLRSSDPGRRGSRHTNEPIQTMASQAPVAIGSTGCEHDEAPWAAACDALASVWRIASCETPVDRASERLVSSPLRRASSPATS